ncbi:hypothetical protein QFC21_004121 [Naganishia friedmannii]|uniref:Uncharacterized protein n=1 Tax=Naganishia friedmannii TaxID=89922 RepID=A0ACC2VKB7_9TREE|nr:hypothetical protein QFC21_004121 [Naganishia friedmannii]
MDSHNKSPSHSHEAEEHHHQQPHQNPEDDADLQSFIQSGMGISLPPLSMGMDTVAGSESQEHQGVAEHHTEDFEVSDFRELMTDGPAERRGKVVSRREEEQEGPEHSEERGQKRTREGSAAMGSAAPAHRDMEERINALQGTGDEDQVRHVDKRLRTAEHSPDATTLQDAPASMPLPTMTAQQEATDNNNNTNDNDNDNNNLEEMTPILIDVDPAQGPGQAGGKQETAEERKVRQREANRLAAGRSRGKKRDELAILEKTVQNIQEENNRLRAQLEALVSAAHHQQPQQASTSTAGQVGTQDGGGSSVLNPASMNEVDDLVSARVEPGGTPVDGGGLESQQQQQSQQAELATTTTGTETRSLDVPLGFGVDGMDMQLLDGLRRQVDDARRQVAELEARIAVKRSAGAVGTSDEPHLLAAAAAAKTRTHALVQEKSALVQLIESLKRERDETDLERDVLEREVSARRVLLAGMEDGDGDDQGAAAVDGGQTPAGKSSGGGASGKGKNGGEAGRDVGVERALMEVRGWLDSALAGWRKTGIIQPPSSILDNISNPLIDAAAIQAQVQQALQHEPLLGGPSHTHSPLNAHEHDESQEYEMDAYGHGGPSMHDDHHSRVNVAGQEEGHHHHSPHDDGAGDGGMLQTHVGGHGGDDETHEGMLESLEGVGLEHIRFYHESGSV